MARNSQKYYWTQRAPIALSALSCLSSGCLLIEQKDPVELPKAQKNAVEVSGIRAAHIRDGAALSEYLCWIEGEVDNGRYHDEGRFIGST